MFLSLSSTTAPLILEKKKVEIKVYIWIILMNIINHVTITQIKI